MNKCIIVGGGTSLTNFNFSQLRKGKDNLLPIFTMNYVFIEMLRKGVKADNWVFWDLDFINKEQNIIDYHYSSGVNCHTISCYNLNKYKEWNKISDRKLFRGVNTVGNMNSTLAFSINIALNQGYKEIYLLGFDNKIDKFEHWYDKQYVSAHRSNVLEPCFKLFNQFMNTIVSELKEDEKIIGINSGFDCIENITFDGFKRKTNINN